MHFLTLFLFLGSAFCFAAPINVLTVYSFDLKTLDSQKLGIEAEVEKNIFKEFKLITDVKKNSIVLLPGTNEVYFEVSR